MIDILDSCCQGLLAEEANASFEFLVLFTTGLMVSLGHCTGMCGPIAAAYAAARQEGGDTGWRMAPALLVYHTGRILSYAVIGAALALAGSLAGWRAESRDAAAVPAALAIGAGLLMFLLGLGFLDLLPTSRWVEGHGIARFVTCRIGELLRARSRVRQFGLGVANGFLPCGPVVAVALGAATSGRPDLGALAMFIYGLGTVPAMVAVGFGASWMAPRLRRRFFRAGAFLILLIGLQLGLRGAAALGAVPHLRFGEFILF